MSLPIVLKNQFRPLYWPFQVCFCRFIVLVVSLTMVASLNLKAQAYNGKAILTTQQQVDAFTYSEVNGTLQINGQNITNLRSLIKLKKVGELIIAINPLLTSLEGLDNLVSVDYYFRILDNPLLTSLAGLSKLTFVGVQLEIVGNEKLSACCIPFTLIAAAAGAHIGIAVNAPGCNSYAEINVACRPATSIISVSYADGTGQQLFTNALNPYLQLNNDGSSAIAFKDITLRYWLTVEDFDSLTTSISWAKLGTNLVSARYVALDQPYTGAYGYIEYAFATGADSLAAMSNSGPILSQMRKSDWTNFNQADDYSYTSSGDYVKNSKVTAYYKGTLVWGTEPSLQTVQLLSLPAFSASRDGAATSSGSIGTILQLKNAGNIPIRYQDITVRYWFTAGGSQSLLYQLDFAKMGALGITTKFVKLPTPLPTADTYLELAFTRAGSLYPMSNTGDLLQRIRKSDWSNFNQLGDYSYINSSALTLNQHITVYLKSITYTKDGLLFGTEPTASSAPASATTQQTVATDQLGGGLRIAVLGSPRRGSEIEVMICGAQGERVKVTVSDALGRLVSEQQIERAAAQERVTLLVGNAASQILYIRVATGKQIKTVIVVKAK